VPQPADTVALATTYTGTRLLASVLAFFRRRPELVAVQLELLQLELVVQAVGELGDRRVVGLGKGEVQVLLHGVHRTAWASAEL